MSRLNRVMGAVLLVLAGILAPGSAWAGGDQEAEALAAACVEEIKALASEGSEALLNEQNAFLTALNQLPPGSMTEAYRLAVATGARADRILNNTSRKIDRMAARCSARLSRLGADPSLFVNVESARESLTGALSGQWFSGVHGSIVSAIDDFHES